MGVQKEVLLKGMCKRLKYKTGSEECMKEDGTCKKIMILYKSAGTIRDICGKDNILYNAGNLAIRIPNSARNTESGMVHPTQ